MSRQQTSQATDAFKQGKGFSQDASSLYGTSAGNSQGLYGQLQPAFTAEATNPQGFAPKDLAAMNTASQQSIGGSTAGAVGEGDLTAARTRNAGGFQAANSEAVRSGQRQLSENALGVQGENAKLKESQRQAGLSGLSDLYSGNQSQALGALHAGTGAVNAETGAVDAGTTAGKSGWFQNMLGLINALKPTAGGGQSPGIGH